MKNATMKWLMVIVSFGLMMANNAYAAFRVKTPTAAVRQQALRWAVCSSRPRIHRIANEVGAFNS